MVGCVQLTHRPQDIQQAALHIRYARAIKTGGVLAQRTLGDGAGGKYRIKMADQQNVELCRLWLITDEYARADLVAQIDPFGVPAFALPERFNNASHGFDACDSAGAAVHVHQGFQLFNIMVKVHINVLFRE